MVHSGRYFYRSLLLNNYWHHDFNWNMSLFLDVVHDRFLVELFMHCCMFYKYWFLDIFCYLFSHLLPIRNILLNFNDLCFSLFDHNLLNNRRNFNWHFYNFLNWHYFLHNFIDKDDLLFGPDNLD